MIQKIFLSLLIFTLSAVSPNKAAVADHLQRSDRFSILSIAEGHANRCTSDPQLSLDLPLHLVYRIHQLFRHRWSSLRFSSRVFVFQRASIPRASCPTSTNFVAGRLLLTAEDALTSNSRPFVRDNQPIYGTNEIVVVYAKFLPKMFSCFCLLAKIDRPPPILPVLSESIPSRPRNVHRLRLNKVLFESLSLCDCYGG